MNPPPCRTACGTRTEPSWSQNDDWQDDPVSAANLTANGLGLSDPKESGIFISLTPPGQFTAILSGKNGGIGIGLVEIYNLK
ncbi:MAG: hypothetical protein QOG51_1572 [Verrucomicrobiota bacterium]|jgi:hypothetical protein